MAKKAAQQEILAQQPVSKPESQNVIPKPIVETDIDVVVEKLEPAVEYSPANQARY